MLHGLWHAAHMRSPGQLAALKSKLPSQILSFFFTMVTNVTHRHMVQSIVGWRRTKIDEIILIIF